MQVFPSRDGQYSIRFSAAAYWLLKQQILHKRFRNIRSEFERPCVDQAGAEISHVVKFYFEESGQYLFTVNLHHTTCLLLVNGKGMELFRQHILPQLEQQIGAQFPKLRELNQMIWQKIHIELAEARAGKATHQRNFGQEPEYTTTHVLDDQ